MRVAMLALAFVLAISGPVAAGPLQDGLAAHERGDFALAMQWYRKAADQGNANAQSILGVMYANGRGVTKDDVQAYMWVNLAAAGTSDADVREQAQKTRDAFAARMTPAQIGEAQRLSREWKPTSGR